MTRVLLLAGIASSGVVAPAVAQDHSMMPGMHMPGMGKPVRKAVTKAKPTARKPVAKKAATRKAPARRLAQPGADPHAGHDMSGMSMPGMSMVQTPAADPHADHDMSSMPATAPTPTGTDLKPGNKPAPAPAPDHLADKFWGAEAMAASRKDDLLREHGGMTYYQLLFNLAEYQVRSGHDGYRWDGEAWIGGDIDRLTVKTEGEGSVGRSLEKAEVQALYSHALDPYWNLQAGIRHDVKPNPSRSYATVAIEGLAPFWFDVEGAVFLSNKGEVLARAEGYYDQRITNYVVLQPRVEANFSAQDMRATGTGSGLTNLEAGLRLRYEGRREFAPYVGVSWERQFGDTARFSRERGDDTGSFSLVAGVRTWF